LGAGAFELFCATFLASSSSFYALLAGILIVQGRSEDVGRSHVVVAIQGRDKTCGMMMSACIDKVNEDVGLSNGLKICETEAPTSKVRE
jgi:hypothetical protein